MKRQVFFISDGTAITAEALGKSLLAQFEQINFETTTLPFINTPQRAADAIRLIEKTVAEHHSLPIIIHTIVEHSLRQQIQSCHAFVVDVFSTFLSPLEKELHAPSACSVGKQRHIDQNQHYSSRINAVHFAINNDDGSITREYDQADIILVGVSRSGKTPTCLYLALQFGIKAANYPFTEDDLGSHELPSLLKPYKPRLFGLTISPQRLQVIRQERLSNSQYASIRQCRQEIRAIEATFLHQRIPYLDITHSSIEEIAARIMQTAGLRR